MKHMIEAILGELQVAERTLAQAVARFGKLPVDAPVPSAALVVRNALQACQYAILELEVLRPAAR